MAVQTIIRNTVNLEEPVVKKILRDVLGSQDEQAHRFEVEVKRGNEAVDLAGASVNGYFIRAGGETVVLTGGVENGIAYIVLSDSCYRNPGHFSFAMKIQVGEVRHTVLWYEGTVGQTSSDSLVDPENVIPSLEDLLDQIERTEQAAITANDAAESAQLAADTASQFANLTVEAVTLGNDAEATASYENGVLTIGLPKGPKGDTGSASPVTVNGIEAVDSDITITAADVGALPDTYEAPVTSVNGQTGAVVVGKTYTVALPASGWSSEAPFAQTATVEGIVETDMPIVDVDMSAATADTAAGILEAWFCVGRIVTGDGTITAYCYEAAPTVDLNIIVKVV